MEVSVSLTLGLHSYRGFCDVTCGTTCISVHTGAVAYYNANFSSGSGPYHLDNVRCRGTESSLLSCSHGYSIGVHNCRPGKAAGVKCGTYMMHITG